MKLSKNPFQYEAANNLADEVIVDYYIDDFNYSRFIQSTRNVFLIGERGSGKTMTLLYNKWDLQKLRAARAGRTLDLSTIGVYVPCNTPLTHKPEYQLLGEFLGSVLAEHILVLAVAYGLADTLDRVENLLEGVDVAALFDETDFLLGVDLPRTTSFFNSVRLFVHSEVRKTQLALNSKDHEAFYDNTYSFISMLSPMFDLWSRNIPNLAETHFSIMIDDAHSLSDFQMRALNSWIAYRDHSRFSFKVAVAKSRSVGKLTSSGGEILEGHDYTTVDLEASLHNRHTEFYALAERIIARRLQKAGVDVSPVDFFPTSESMARDLERSKEEVRARASEQFSPENVKGIADYVYKQARAHYFRSRSPKANRPPYSGFQTLVFLSTGVIRNLLEPCFWMFDRVVSSMEDGSAGHVVSIPSDVQSDVIRTRSERLWTWLREEIAQDIEGCSTEDGKRAYQMLDALADLFRERLLRHDSEPSATSFTLSSAKSQNGDALERLLGILMRAQLIYVRDGPAKERGTRERYYVPNRMLWPVRGLDPHGQHARVSIPIDDLWAGAEKGRLPTRKLLQNEEADSQQQDLFQCQ